MAKDTCPSVAPKWISVYKNSVTTYLCKLYVDHYEIEAEGDSSSIDRLVKELNAKG